jgi:hypothetical protein
MLTVAWMPEGVTSSWMQLHHREALALDLV